MNDKIRQILEKYEISLEPSTELTKALNSAIIEICEEQKKSIVNEIVDDAYAIAYYIDNYSKNIAE
jgi:phage host-nuclease inhibitor protein Gam